MANNPVNCKTLPVKLATFFGLGYLPKAPGTWGSLAGLPIAAAIHALANLATTSTPLRIVVALFFLAILTGLSFWAIRETQKLWSNHDDPRIVIDEVLGQTAAVVFLPTTVATYVLGFVLFRFFDILKPWPISWADRSVPGTAGVILDDLLAAVAAALVLAILTCV